MIPIARPRLDHYEYEAVQKVLESGMIASGATVSKFEAEFARYIGVKFATATSSGTTALHAAIVASGIKQGDKVITTPFTFAATANSILFEKAIPVFVDIDPETYNIDAGKIEEAILKDKSIKGILIVHLFGLACNMDPILDMVKKHNAILIEDAAQAHGAMYKNKMAGSFGHASTFSFYPTKNMTTSEGGMVLTNNEDIYQLCKTFINHGQAERYIHADLGHNFRMTNIAAAIGVEQLKKLDKFNEARISNALFYNKNIKNSKVKLPYIPNDCKHVYHQYTLKVENREQFVKYLTDNQIGTGIHYPVPLNEQPYYKSLGYTNKDTPIASEISKQVVSIPVNPLLSQAELEYIIKVINGY